MKRPRVDKLLNRSLDELKLKNPSVVVHTTSRLELLPSLLKNVAIFGNFMLPKTVTRSRKLVGTVRP